MLVRDGMSTHPIKEVILPKLLLIFRKTLSKQVLIIAEIQVVPLLGLNPGATRKTQINDGSFVTYLGAVSDLWYFLNIFSVFVNQQKGTYGNPYLYFRLIHKIQ